jgi:hypothetical protein
MTFKPEIRVGIDWDGDGFIHLGGAAGGVSPLSNPLNPNVWSKGWDDYLDDITVYAPLVDSSVGFIESQIPVGQTLAKAIHFLQASPYRIQTAYAPDQPADTYDMTNFTGYTTGGYGTTEVTVDPRTEIVTDNHPETEIDGTLDLRVTVDTDTDLEDSAGVSITNGGFSRPNLFDNDNATWETVTHDGTDAILDIDFGSGETIDIGQLVIRNYTDTTNYATDRVLLKYSDDDISYTNARCFETNTGLTWTSEEEKTFNFAYDSMTDGRTEGYRYWRIVMRGALTGAVRLEEITIHPMNRTKDAIAFPFVPNTDLLSKVQVHMDFVEDIAILTKGLTVTIESDSNGSPSGELVDPNSTYTFDGVTVQTKIEDESPYTEFDFTDFNITPSRTYWIVFTSLYDTVNRAYYRFDTDSTDGHVTSLKVKAGNTGWTDTGVSGIFRVYKGDPYAGFWDGVTGYEGENNSARFRLGADYSATPTTVWDVTAGESYVFQCWVKYTSAVNEYATGQDLRILGISDVHTQYVCSEHPISPEVIGSHIPPNTWIPIAIEFEAPFTASMVFEIYWDCTLVTTGGTNNVVGFMMTSSDWSHDYTPSFNTTSTPVIGTTNAWASTTNASSTNGGNVASNTEVDDTSYWESTGNPDTADEWLRHIDSAINSEFTGELSITCDDANYAPKDFEFGFLRLDGGGTYTPALTVTGATWTTGETKTWAIPKYNVGSDYARITVSAVQDGTSNVRIRYVEMLPNLHEYNVPTKWVSPIYYSAAKTYASTDFVNTLLTNTTYKIGFYAKSDVAKDYNYSLRDYNHGLATYYEDTGTIALTTEYQFFEYTGATTPSNAHSFVFAMGLVSEAEADTTLYIKGVAVYTEADGYHINSSDTATYDNLQAYLQNTDWQLGKKKYFDPLAYEGTLNVVVDNTSRIFSPANADSPLYGLLKQNLKVLVQVKRPSTGEWVTMWAGWTDKFDAMVGTASAKKATIRCKQGVYRLREGEFSWLPKDDQRISDVIPDVVNYSGWRTTATPLQWWLSKTRQLGVDTFLVATSDIWATLDTGINVYEYIGHGWNNATKVETALKELLEAEDAVLWVRRDGRLELLTRDRFAYFGTSDATIDVGTLTKAEYTYGENLINTVEMFVKPKEETQNTIVWRTKEQIHVRGKRGGGASDPILLTFEYEEGKERTVDNLQLSQEDMDVLVYEVPTPKRRRRQLISAEVAPVSDEGITIKTQDNGQGKTYLYITNDKARDRYVDISIYGDFITGGEGVSYEFQDLDAIADYDALHKVELKSNIVTTESQVKSLADLRLIRNGYPEGEFSWIEIISEDTTLTEQILDLTLGSLISLSEGQTGETDKVHVVLGEKVTVKNGLLYMRYDLARVPTYTFMKFGDNLNPDSIFYV